MPLLMLFKRPLRPLGYKYKWAALGFGTHFQYISARDIDQLFAMQEATTKVYPLDTLRRSDEAVQTIGHIPEGCSNLFVSLRCSSVMVATATTPSLRLAIRTNYLQRGLEIYWTWVPSLSKSISNGILYHFDLIL